VSHPIQGKVVCMFRVSTIWPDSTLTLLREGYLWFPERIRRSGGKPISTRLGGRRATGLSGPEALQFFYDEAHIQRHDAIPGPVLSTLFGHGAVHTLDGGAHRHRKAMLLSVMSAEDTADLVTRTLQAWDEAVARWQHADQVVLFDEASRVLTRAVCDWADVPVSDDEVPDLAADLVALVDGFATAGRRHWRARSARRRREAWLAGLIQDVRHTGAARPGSALAVIAAHREDDGSLLEPRTAAVELLNVLRPTVAVCWFIAYAGHALQQWPEYRDRLRSGDPAYPTIFTLGFATAFTNEVRRFYPFAPFIGGKAVKDLDWQGQSIPRGSMVIVDLYGQNHDERWWPEPYRFQPERFLNHSIGEFELVPQGGGNPHSGHRCPGEGITIGLLEALTLRLAALDYDVPPQDLSIRANRIPARVNSGLVISNVSVPVASTTVSPLRPPPHR
jgi:fatty-acid peroxygenase